MCRVNVHRRCVQIGCECAIYGPSSRIIERGFLTTNIGKCLIHSFREIHTNAVSATTCINGVEMAILCVTTGYRFHACIQNATGLRRCRKCMNFPDSCNVAQSLEEELPKAGECALVHIPLHTSFVTIITGTIVNCSLFALWFLSIVIDNTFHLLDK